MGLFWSAFKKAVVEPQVGNVDPVGNDAQLYQLVPRLEGISSSIKETTKDTEQQFLAIGEQLHAFHFDASTVTSVSEEIVFLISGDETDQAVATMSAVLDQMGEYIAHEKQETGHSLKALENILGLLTKVTDSLDGFRKIIKVLHALGTSTKIESVRLGDDNAGFFNLAMDVEKLSLQIKAKSASIMALRDELVVEIKKSLQRIAAISASELQNADAIFARMRSAIELFGSRKEATSSAIAIISDLSAELSATIGDIVSSVQFHDITRQQIEHVHETIDEICHNITTRAKSHEELAGEIPSVILLQAAQLEHAVEEFVEAVNGIASGLSSVAGTSASIATEALGMAGSADGAGDSFLTGIDHILSSVTGILSDSGEATRNLSTAMVSVSKTIGHITGFVNDIEDIGMEIELIALNAQIKAARTGSEGAALGVLAEAIQKLSVEARSQSTEVSGILREVTNSSETLQSSVNMETETLEAEVTGMIGRLSGIVNAVGDMNRKMVPLLQQINSVTSSISQRTEMMVKGMTVHESLSRALLPLSSQLSGMFPGHAGASSAEMLAGISRRYTMHSERRVHERITGKVTAANSRTASPEPPSGGDFGDNVELF